MLDVQNIDLYYGASQALRGVSLSAVKGEVTCVMGRNGVGKTSLLRALVGHPQIQPSFTSAFGLKPGPDRCGCARRYVPTARCPSGRSTGCCPRHRVNRSRCPT